MTSLIVVFVDGKYAYACSLGASRAYVDGIEACAALLGASARVNTYVLPDDEDEMVAQQGASEIVKSPWRSGMERA